MDNSDYNLPRTKLHELLPEPYNSDVNKSVFENLFNRFLTKSENHAVAGYIGDGNPNALISRQINEPTIHRQASQLQPILYNKIGSIEHMASWKDILNELTRLGVDVDRLSEWGQAQVFNWVPPIDIDKIIHYRDYFWVDLDNPISQPQYLTIRSRCATATAQAAFHQRLVDQFGDSVAITTISAVDTPPTNFSVIAINTAGQYVRVSGDATTDFNSLDFFKLSGTVSNNNEYQIQSALIYDAGNDWTTIDVGPGVLVADEFSGTVATQRFDKLILPGDFSRLLEPGFVFFFKNSTNVELNDSFLTVLESSHDESADQTTVLIDNVVTHSADDGEVSLQEQLDIFLAERACQCTGSVGWDVFSWDDNPNDPIWNGDLVTLISSISNPSNPNDLPNNGAGIEGQLWFDTVSDQFFQFGATIGWKLLYNKFQTILDATRGLSLWDFTPDCGIQSKVDAANQWIDQNKWVHKTDVTNFSIAKQASLPIIEYDWDLELNEWSFTDYVWKYRAEKFTPFAETADKPTLIELISLDSWLVGLPNEIVLDGIYGDLTNSFSVGSKFQTLDTSDILEVVSSSFESSATGQPHKTKIVITLPISSTALTPGVSPLRPFRSSQGDPWKAYHDHWLFVGTTTTTAVNHQHPNPLIVEGAAAAITDVNFESIATPYAQTYTITSVAPVNTFLLSNIPPIGSSRILRRRALVDHNDIRVYCNDVRVYGVYDETSETVVVVDPTTLISESVDYVSGIVFMPGFEPSQFDIVRIEVGEAAISELGLYAVPVRTIEQNASFENIITGGPTTISLISYRKVEQVKTQLNQYPLFDLYHVDGSSAFVANSIFAFQTAATAPVAGAISQRIVVDDTGTNFSFEQFLCDADTNAVYAYRDYSNESTDYWVNTDTDEVMFWDGLTWNVNGYQGDKFGPATVGMLEPQLTFNGQVWHDTHSKELKIYSGGSFVTQPTTDVNFIEYDITLQTIWKKGLNDEKYIPVKVDWRGRTLVEYDAEKQLFVTETAEELLLATPTLTQIQATTQAELLWLDNQVDSLSPTGVWIGDWDIPDPLYFNNQHENRKVLDSSELLSHFNSIITNQPSLPGFTGPDSARFHLIRTEDVNYGVGGLIKEYNGGFDTFLSSIFVNNVTPPTLFEFAHDQYESLLNNLKETFRSDARRLMTDISTDSLVDFNQFAINNITTTTNQNDNLSKIYGDSTTFTEVIGGADTGVRNWIATLVYLKLVNRALPEFVVDLDRGINQIIHHDGHREEYMFESAVSDGIARLVINTTDSRSIQSAPANTFGQISTNSPANNVTQFVTDFGESMFNRAGVYWYQVNGSTRTLYRLAVAAASNVEPSVSLPNGTLWMDIDPGNEVLRIKNGTSWDVVGGLVIGDGRLHNGSNPLDISTSTISAWQEFRLDEILGSVVLDVEQKLYQNSQIPPELNFDFDSLQNTPANVALYDSLLEKAFLSFTRQSDIRAPFINSNFSQTDAFTWNYKRSSPGISFEILTATASNNTFVLSGDVTSSFTAFSVFFIKNSGDNDGQWTVMSSTHSLGQTSIIVVESVSDSIEGVIYKGTLPSPSNTGAESGGDWRDYYYKLYNTPYPHLEPWKLQEYIDKPSWWDTEYKNDDTVTYGNRRWKYIHATTTGMWENIRLGIIPTGQLLPDGVTISTGIGSSTTSYRYFSVNIADVSISADGGTTNFDPDDVLPPFFDFVLAGEPAITTNRSIFQSFSIEISSPTADYFFGDAGPIEFEWRASSQFLYDQLQIAFSMQPVEFINSTFGFEIDVINKLDFDSSTQQTPCHCRTDFHGEVVDNSLVQVDGLNQWYVNYNRFLGFDISLSDFRSLWTLWTAPLMYQFSSFVDTSSLQVAHRTVPLSEFDFRIASKRSPGADDFWLDAFNVRVLNIPPNLARYDNQLQWRLEIDTHSPLNRTIDYYDVRNFQFSVNPITDICTIYSYPVISVDIFNENFSVQGDQTSIFAFGREFDIINSTSNNGSYEVVSSVYDATSNTTIIQTNIGVISAISDGDIVANYRDIPWQTGDAVWFSSEEEIPAPLQGDQRLIGPTKYFIIRLNATQFQVANTKQNALSSLPIDIISSGRRNSFVGEISTTFRALDSRNTNTLWRHYVVDKTNVLSFTPPNDIQGMQTLVNLIDGYEAFAYDQGFRINENKQQRDVDTQRFVDWQIEVERFINFAYGLRVNRNNNLSNRYEAIVSNITTDTWTWTDMSPDFITGTPVNVMSDNTIYPAPIISNIKYYIIRDSASEFRLAAAPTFAEQGIAIDITSMIGVGNLTISTVINNRTALPNQEINPFRNALFFEPPRGIVSNLLTGPSEDIRNTQLLFDQYGRPLNTKQLRIFRQDKQTQISVVGDINNDIELTSVFNDPYNFLHLGGAHIFIDAFEHVLIFNNNTTEGSLLYDPFLGLNVTKFELLFNRQSDFTERPNIGGSYFKTFFNQGAELLDNFESAVDNIRNLYDSHRVIESKPIIRESRKALGYEGTRDYLDHMNLNEKSQFLFWKGLIQHKGSIQSVDAFVNSRRFIDAKVDEFWAYKIAEFGSTKDKEYPEMFLTTNDARSNDLRLQFVEDGDFCDAGFGEDAFDSPTCGFDIITDSTIVTDPGFTPISLTDQSRWYNQPDQLDILRNNGLAFYFDLKTIDHVGIIISPTEPSAPNHNDGWIDTSASPVFVFNRYNANANVMAFEIHGTWDTTALTPLNLPILRHDFNADNEIVTIRTYPEGTRTIHTSTTRTAFFVPGQIANSFVQGEKTVTLLNDYIPFTGHIQVFKNGTELDELIGYVQTVDGLGGLFFNEIVVVDILDENDVIEVVYTPVTLSKDTHYEVISANTVRLLFEEFIDVSYQIDMWGQIVNEAAQNPAKIIDRSAGAVVSAVQIWDPARNFQYQTAELTIQLRQNADPAVYTHTIETDQIPPGSDIRPYVLYSNPWNNTEVGTTWLDTTNLDYIRYFDKQAFPDLDTRLRLWGQLATWGELVIYEWIESDVPPDQYDALAEEDEGNRDIPEHLRKAGRARQTLFENIGTVPNPIWIPMNNKYQEVDTAIEGDDIGGAYEFLLDSININPGDIINVYVNGILVSENVTATNPMVVADLTLADRVRFVNLAPTDEVVIQAGIDAGTLSRGFEHTEVPTFDEFGIQRTLYYFWVSDKGTRNSTQDISPKDAQTQLINIPIPYMVTLKSLPAEVRTNGVLADLTRNWNHNITQSDLDRFNILGRQIVVLGIQVKAVDILNIDVILNGTLLTPTTEFILSASGREIEILPANLLVVDDAIELNYVTEIPTEIFNLPNRNVELVVRGLRGLITDDRRFTLRFTRDFTLRDTLETGNTSLDLKQHHEEWQLIREEQPFLIPRSLWDKVTESIVGFKLNNIQVRVPSLERELYDTTFDTETKYGLRDGQAFTSGPTALQTVLSDLQNPDNEFPSVDINSFFVLNSFDTPDNVITSMNVIYNSFTFIDVNRIFFAVLHDAFSFKKEYPDIFKTSMVSIHGIRPFQVSGLFDD